MRVNHYLHLCCCKLEGLLLSIAPNKLIRQCNVMAPSVLVFSPTHNGVWLLLHTVDVIISPVYQQWAYSVRVDFPQWRVLCNSVIVCFCACTPQVCRRRAWSECHCCKWGGRNHGRHSALCGQTYLDTWPVHTYTKSGNGSFFFF